MKTLDYLKMAPQNAETTVEELQVLLASLQVYYANLRGYHWNVKGVEFFGAHRKYEELYNDTAEKVDEVAERILMLGGVPVHNFSEYLRISPIKESGVVSDTREIAKEILNSLALLIEMEREIMVTASAGNDDGSITLMSDFIPEQEKTVWMLTAYLS